MTLLAQQNANTVPAVQRGRNVGRGERWLSLLGGGVALGAGVYRGGAPGLALCGAGAYLLWRGASGRCPLYRLLRTGTAKETDPGLLGAEQLVLATRMHVDRPPQDVYRYWRNFENLPQFMRHLKSVSVTDDRSHWVARGPLGLSMSWDEHITHDTPNQRLAWRSEPGSRMDARGEVRFKPTDDGGTLLEIELYYRPPGGALTLLACRLLGGLSARRLRRDLSEFRRALELQEAAELGPITAAHA